LTKQPKDKTCKICRVKYTPNRPLQFVCSFECSYTHAKVVRVKTERKETKEAKIKLKSKADWLREAQIVFNQFIRLRDKDEPCISCHKTFDWNGQWHASHYRSVGASPELRFNELNVHKSCSICNNYLSGNIMSYRIKLIEKIGISAVEHLESKHEANHYTIDDIKELKVLYKQKIKALDTKNS